MRGIQASFELRASGRRAHFFPADVTFSCLPDSVSVIADLASLQQESGADAGSGNRPATIPVTFSWQRDTVGVSTRATTFHELYARYADDVYRFAHWLTGNPHDAHDITSETFVRVWTAAKSRAWIR